MSCAPGRAHTPLKSGFPFGRRGAGAFKSGLAFSVWLTQISAKPAAMTIKSKSFFTVGLLSLASGPGLLTSGRYPHAEGFIPPLQFMDRVVRSISKFG